MRISGATFTVLAAVSALTLSACGGGVGGGTSNSNANLPPVISGTPATQLNAGTAYSFQPSAIDPDGDRITFAAENLPVWASINTTSGLVSGTPSEANVGTSGMITIEASDGRVSSQLPSFRIEVLSNNSNPPPVNSAPTITGSPATTATVGQAYTFAPVANDADDDALTFSIANKPSWATFTPATGRLTGTPASGNVGTTSGIVISVQDATHITSLAAFSIVVSASAPTNRPPTITGTPATSVTVGNTYNFQPVGSDPDGNALTYSIQGKPSWATFTTSSGRLRGTPTSANLGTSTVTISVTDGTATVSLPAFTLQVVAAANRPPVITGTPPASATVGQQYSFTPTSSDPDGQSLTFTISGKPAWITFNTANGGISGTPAAGDVGTASGISITASDGTAISTLGPFSIVVAQIANGSATLNWVAPTENTDDSALTNLAGYRITYGRSTSTLNQQVNIANPGLTTYTVNNLSTGTWYFVMYAYSSTGSESDASNTASKTIN